jgi:hypothetical protein
MKTKFCYFLTDKVDANNLIAIAEINFIVTIFSFLLYNQEILSKM